MIIIWKNVLELLIVFECFGTFFCMVWKTRINKNIFKKVFSGVAGFSD